MRHLVFVFLVGLVSAETASHADISEVTLTKARRFVQQGNQLTPGAFSFYSWYAGIADVDPILQFPTGQSVTYSTTLGDLALGPFATEAALEAAAPPGQYIVHADTALATPMVAFGDPWPDPMPFRDPSVFDAIDPDQSIFVYCDRPTDGSWNHTMFLTDVESGQWLYSMSFSIVGNVLRSPLLGQYLEPSRQYALSTAAMTNEGSIFTGAYPFEYTRFFAERVSISTIYFTTIPTPGAEFALGLGALVASRRRR